MISDFETNTVYLSKLLSTDRRFAPTFNEILGVLQSFETEVRLIPNTKDIWARDYMPVQINESDFIEYRYDPDYLQGNEKGFRDLKTYPDLVCDDLGLNTKKSDLIIDGGNIIRSHNSILLTDKVVRENRYSYTKKKLITVLHDTFEVEKVILIPWDKHEISGHSDGMVRFIDDENVLINYHYRNDNSMLQTLKDHGINYEFLDFKNSIDDHRDWAYINFLQTKDFIIIPSLGIDRDEEAFTQIESLFSSYKNKVAQVNMSEIVKYGGALNCVTWTIRE